MKKILLKFVLVLAVLGLTTFTSCEIEPPTPACESENFGWVTVKNSTGHNCWVDVTWGSVVENYEKLLYNGNSHKYNNIPAGGIEIWISFDGNDWYYEYENLSACEDMNYTWYLNARKSISLLMNGQDVKPMLKIKE